ncbi:MAG: hypothetical protein PHU80_08220 [Kiritimatiellae bacterium]|nr:hypothetical protein [Kiritimatiellia bacterium]
MHSVSLDISEYVGKNSHKAESDIAVAAASVLAREAFLRGLGRLGETHGIQAHKGASEQVKASAVELVKKSGPEILLKTAKCHFKTADQVLAACGSSRAALGPEGQAVSRSKDSAPARRQGFRPQDSVPGTQNS